MSFYELNYGIGASATVIDQLNDLSSNIKSVVVEPHRLDLPTVKIRLSNNVRQVKIPLPFKAATLFLYPFIAFFFCLELASNFKPNVIISMQHPFHYLAITGHIISMIFRIPHVVDLHDVARNMSDNNKFKLSFLNGILEVLVIKLITNDLMIFVCSEHKQLLEARIKSTIRNALILPNCVSKCLIDSIKIRKVKNKKEIHFVFAGRVGKEYALHKIQNIFKTLPSYGYKPKFIIIGHNQTGIPEYATYMGPLSRKKTLKLIAESDVGIGPLNPTLTIPLKVVEYLALGKIVIAGKNAISKDLLREFGDYIIEISKNDDPHKIINKLLSMLESKKGNPSNISDKLYCKNKMITILERALSR